MAGQVNEQEGDGEAEQGQTGGGAGGAGGLFKAKDFFRARFTRPAYLDDVRSGKPQTVIKIISSGEGKEVKNLLLYIARARGKDIENRIEAVTLIDQDGIEVSGRDEVIAKFKDWEEYFVSRDLKPGMKNRHARHMLLSIKAEATPKTIERLNATAGEFLHEHLGKRGFEYVFAIHGADKDAGHPHVHVIVKNRNTITDAPFDINRTDIFYMRSKLAETLDRNGLTAIATARQDHLMEEIIQGIEPLRTRGEYLKETRAGIEKGENKGCELEARRSLEKAIAWQIKQTLKVDYAPIRAFKARKALRQIQKDINSVSRNQLKTYLQHTLAHIATDDKNTQVMLTKQIKQIKSMEIEIGKRSRTSAVGLERQAQGKRLEMDAQKLRAEKTAKTIELAIAETKTILSGKEKKAHLIELRKFKERALVAGGINIKRGRSHTLGLEL